MEYYSILALLLMSCAFGMASYKGFTSTELRAPERSKFNLSHEKRLSTRIGKLTPVFITETIPNDTFHGSTEVLIKLAPMIAPIFHRLNVYVHYFFVPNRIMWKDWEPFITGGRVGENVTSPPVPPYFKITDLLATGNSLLNIRSLADYLGVPPIADEDSALWANRTIDAMPFIAFSRIWYDYYRDRNFVADQDTLYNSGDMGGANWPVAFRKYRCWEHDYFTSALPWTQRGAEVLMPLEGTGRFLFQTADGSPVPAGKVLRTGDGLVIPANQLTFADTDLPPTNQGGAELVMDSSEVSINDFRQAVALQSWMERNALGGSRYTESTWVHFKRKMSDGRIQRAEYIGGGKAVIQISEVNTTAYSEDAAAEVVPPGNPAGRGSAYSDINRFHYNCEEHGFIIGILSVMPSSSYMQGIPRMFQNRNTFLEYPWPSFAHLGEQEVYDNEIYMDPTSMPVDRTTQPVFGYQSRYSDWKFIQSSTHGDFRESLDHWHLTRKFASLPALGNAFVTFEDALQDRVFNVSGVDTLWVYIYNKVSVIRALPYFGTPSTITK